MAVAGFITGTGQQHLTVGVGVERHNGHHRRMNRAPIPLHHHPAAPGAPAQLAC
jgi:hypothetical protein